MVPYALVTRVGNSTEGTIEPALRPAQNINDALGELAIESIDFQQPERNETPPELIQTAAETTISGETAPKRLATADDFVEIYYKYLGNVTAFVLSRLSISDKDRAEDIVQQVFSKAFVAMQNGRGPKYANKDIWHWLFHNASNEVITSWREKRHRDNRLPLDSPDISRKAYRDYLENSGPMPFDERVVEQDEINAILPRLPERQRQVLILTYYEGLKPREIADIMEIRSGAVRTLLDRAKASYRRIATELARSRTESN